MNKVLSQRGILFAAAAITAALSWCFSAGSLKNFSVLGASSGPHFAQSAAVLSSASNGASTTGRFAYAFVAAGCTEDSCIGYILNVIVASRILQDHNSTADVVFLLQMNSGSQLPAAHKKWLSRAGVQVMNLPTNTTTNTYALTQLNKFRILDMTTYDRVMMLDSDAIPLCNLDYMFRHSYKKNGLLQGQVGVRGKNAPLNGGFMLVTPHIGGYHRFLDIVAKHRNRTRDPFVFNTTLGWGQQIRPPDRWVSSKYNGTTWVFQSAGSGQGLLYHWMRYVKMNYSRIAGGVLETWRDVTHSEESYRNGSAALIPVGNKVLAMVKGKVNDLGGCCKDAGLCDRPSFNGDTVHFGGRRVPWINSIVADQLPNVALESIQGQAAKTDKITLGTKLWLYYLGRANKTFSLELPSSIETSSKLPLSRRLNTPLDPDIELPY